MERVTLTPQICTQVAERAAAVLGAGGVIVYPTETLYGLGADALSDDAIARICAIKGRSVGKPIHALVSDEAMAAQYGEIDANARMLISRIEEPLSLVVKKKSGIEKGILKGMDTFGFRIAKHTFCKELVRVFNRPVTTTSANKAGRLPERSIPAILEQLGSAANDIDLVIDAGTLSECPASTIVDLSMDPAHDGGPLILREGAVPAADIWQALRTEL
jgi:L-threonylcarbamoyladenylate synthase